MFGNANELAFCKFYLPTNHFSSLASMFDRNLRIKITAAKLQVDSFLDVIGLGTFR